MGSLAAETKPSSADKVLFSPTIAFPAPWHCFSGGDLWGSWLCLIGSQGWWNIWGVGSSVWVNLVQGENGWGSHLEVLLGRVLQHPFSPCPRAIRQLKVLLGDTTRSRAASAPLISETARICHVEISRWSDSPKHTPYYEDVQKPLPAIPFTQRKSLPDLAPGEWFNALYTNGTGHTAAGETVYPTEQQPGAEGTSPCSLLCNSLGIWYCQFFFAFKNSWKVLISQLRPFFPHLYTSFLFLQHAVFSCSQSYLHWLGCFQAGTGRWMKKWVLQEKVY